MSREKVESELRRLLVEKEKQENKLKDIQKQLDRLVFSWKNMGEEPPSKPVKGSKKKRAIQVTEEERNRRSERMKKYWEKFRKEKSPAPKPSPVKK